MTAPRPETRDRRPWLQALWWLAAILVLFTPSRALAHCDTVDGPVVKDARAALEARDVTPALKWVGEGKEAGVREAFRHAQAVRALGPEARALADRFFFETLVRVHREGEGAPYTGLKPAGTAVSPAVAGADEALDRGDVDALARTTTAAADQGLRARFARAAEARRHAGESVEKGRSYIAAYVELAHYAERLLESATSPAANEGSVPQGRAEGHAH
jgi:hypothetical protein